MTKLRRVVFLFRDDGNEPTQGDIEGLFYALIAAWMRVHVVDVVALLLSVVPAAGLDAGARWPSPDPALGAGWQSPACRRPGAPIPPNSGGGPVVAGLVLPTLVVRIVAVVPRLVV